MVSAARGARAAPTQLLGLLHDSLHGEAANRGRGRRGVGAGAFERCTAGHTHRLVLLSGRDGASSTVSPTLHSCSSSCAWWRVVTRTRFW